MQQFPHAPEGVVIAFRPDDARRFGLDQFDRDCDGIARQADAARQAVPHSQRRADCPAIHIR